MAVITAVVVTIFGGLTLILRDDTFVKMKPTILYALFAGILGFGLLRGQSYLRYLMDELIPMQRRGLDEVHPAVRGLLPAARRR